MASMEKEKWLPQDDGFIPSVGRTECIIPGRGQRYLPNGQAYPIHNVRWWASSLSGNQDYGRRVRSSSRTSDPAPGSGAHWKPDIQVPYLYIDMGVAVLCASFMSFGVKRRWFALVAALQLAISTYASYMGGQVHYGDWLKVRMYSRALAITGGFLVLASGAGEVYRQKPRTRSLQSTGQIFLGIYLICMVSIGFKIGSGACAVQGGTTRGQCAIPQVHFQYNRSEEPF
ncbi:UNVERIFIED_CONTAM: hypothetical protein FKN15_033525 [Acipenser sinensis]